MQTLGLLSSGSRPKKLRYSQYPLFFWPKVGTSLVGKNTVLLNLEWRKLTRLGELMHALNACLDIKNVLTACFLTTIDCSRSLRGSATSPSCQ